MNRAPFYNMSNSAKIFLTLFLTYAFFTNTYLTTNDAPRFCTAAAIVDHGTLEISRSMREYFPYSPDREGWQPRDFALINGRYYSNKAPLGSFLAVPAYFVITRVTRTPRVVIFLVSLFTAGLLGALCGVVLYKTGLAMGAGERMGILMGLGYGLASMAMFYGGIFFSNALTAFFILVGFYLLFRYRSGSGGTIPAAAGACLGLAVMSDYYAVLCAAPLLLYALTRRGAFVRACSGFALTTAMLLVYHYHLTGNPFETPYRYSYLYHTLHSTGFYGVALPSLKGLVRLFELLFSPLAHVILKMSGAAVAFEQPTAEKWGFVVTNMPAVLGLFFLLRFGKQYRAEAYAFAAAFAALLFLNMSQGWFDAYSARFFMPVLPLLFVPLARFPASDARWRNVLFFIVGFSFTVNALGCDAFMPELKSAARPGMQNLLAQALAARGIQPGYITFLVLPALYAVVWLLPGPRSKKTAADSITDY